MPSCFKTCTEEEVAHVTFSLCSEFYLNATFRVHFSVAFKRIYALHKFLEQFSATLRRGKILFFKISLFLFLNISQIKLAVLCFAFSTRCTCLMKELRNPFLCDRSPTFRMPYFGSNSPLYGAKLQSNARCMPGVDEQVWNWKVHYKTSLLCSFYIWYSIFNTFFGSNTGSTLLPFRYTSIWVVVLFSTRYTLPPSHPLEKIVVLDITEHKQKYEISVTL